VSNTNQYWNILHTIAATTEEVDIGLTWMYYFMAIHPCCVFSQYNQLIIHHHNTYCECILYTIHCARRLFIYWICCLKTQHGLNTRDQSLQNNIIKPPESNFMQICSMILKLLYATDWWTNMAKQTFVVNVCKIIHSLTFRWPCIMIYSYNKTN